MTETELSKNSNSFKKKASLLRYREWKNECISVSWHSKGKRKKKEETEYQRDRKHKQRNL